MTTIKELLMQQVNIVNPRVQGRYKPAKRSGLKGPIEGEKHERDAPRSRPTARLR